MWMLVRADSLGTARDPDTGERILAACPDSAERGDPWRWSVNLSEALAGPILSVDVDPEFIAVGRASHLGDESVRLTREAGRQIVITVISGGALIAATDGPWERVLGPGDVFIVEGEDPEELWLALSGGSSRVEIVTLAPLRAHALRWVP